MKPSLKVKVVQYFWGEGHTAYRLGGRINEAYCRRHGYEHIVQSFSSRPDRACLWEKLPAIRSELHDCDFLMYLDADAFFYSHDLKLEEELVPLLEDKQIMMAADVASEAIRRDPSLPNSGTILIRTSARSEEILRVWDESSQRPELSRYRFAAYHEQEACWRTVWKEYADEFKLLREYYLMNGYYGPFIRHLMAMSNKDRLAVLHEYLERRPWLLNSEQQDIFHEETGGGSC